MSRHRETRTLAYLPEQMFDLVVDVARYPEFLPWVSAARVQRDGRGDAVAELVLGYGGLTERFRSRVRAVRPNAIDIDHVDGPLKHLRNEWRFSATEDGGCVIDFFVDFAFRSRLLDAVAIRVFPRALSQMIAAFKVRAQALYGAGGMSSSSAQSTA